MITRTTSQELREAAAEIRAKGDWQKAMLLERAAIEIEHRDDLIKSYQRMMRDA